MVAMQKTKFWKGAKSVKKSMNKEDVFKLKKTLRWYNKHGGVQKEVKINDVMGPLKRMGKWKAFQTLKGLEEKAQELENPTAWILGAAKKAGALKALDEELDQKIRKTVAWYNSNGGLQQPLSYCLVSSAFATLKPSIALAIMKEFGEKGPELVDPNGWISAKAKQLEKQWIVKKMAYWLNTKGGLKAKLWTEAIIWPLSTIHPWQAKDILNNLSKKKREVQNPTAWVNGWARRCKENNRKWQNGEAVAEEAVQAPATKASKTKKGMKK